MPTGLVVHQRRNHGGLSYTVENPNGVINTPRFEPGVKPLDQYDFGTTRRRWMEFMTTTKKNLHGIGVRKGGCAHGFSCAAAHTL